MYNALVCMYQLTYDCILCLFFFFFKQKTAYEMRISDWSSDVCSSDLALVAEAADADRLTLDGEFAAGLSDGADNLVLRVLTLMRERHGADRVPPLAIGLTTNLPVAAGIGRASDEAAALDRAVRRTSQPARRQPRRPPAATRSGTVRHKGGSTGEVQGRR